MAYVRQGITVYKNNSKNSQEQDDDWLSEFSDFVILVEKTGYYNFWVGDKHYYYDARTQTNTITNHVLLLAFNSWKNSKEEKKKKKGKIKITKK